LLPSAPKIVLAKKLYRDKTIGLDDICATLKMSRSTLYRYVAMKSDKLKPQAESG
jgi:predicted DNA-binding transcriptional regulator AlpA